MVKERATFISDFWALSSYFFEAPKTYDENATKKALKENTADLMVSIKAIINGIDDFSTEKLQTEIKGWITNNNIGFGQVMMPLRIALVGALQGPDVFDIMYLIGKEETVKRIETLIKTI